MHEISILGKNSRFPTTDMQTPLPHLRSDHLDIKDAQCPKKMMDVKFHITSYFVWVLRPFKRGVLGAQKFNFL